MLACRADELEEAARIIRSQLPHRNAIWINGMARRNLGGDVSHFIHDIHRFETTGRIRDPTWGRAGDPVSARPANNTMGYQLRQHSPSSAPTST
jgi:hypothetical protein